MVEQLRWNCSGLTVVVELMVEQFWWNNNGGTVVFEQ